MSRVAKSPVVIPAGVEVTLAADKISVKGSGGTLSLAQNVLVKVANNEGKVSFEPANDSREANAMSGTLRQLVNVEQEIANQQSQLQDQKSALDTQRDQLDKVRKERQQALAKLKGQPVKVSTTLVERKEPPKDED